MRAKACVRWLLSATWHLLHRETTSSTVRLDPSMSVAMMMIRVCALGLFAMQLPRVPIAGPVHCVFRGFG